MMTTERPHRLYTPVSVILSEEELKVALGLSNPEPLVKAERVERVFYQLQQVIDYPDRMKFAAYIQEPTDEEPDRLAIFLVTSVHPRNKERTLITITPIKHDVWREIEQSYRHYANLSDPIRPIFAGTVRRHMAQYRNLKEVND